MKAGNHFDRKLLMTSCGLSVNISRRRRSSRIVMSAVICARQDHQRSFFVYIKNSSYFDCGLKKLTRTFASSLDSVIYRLQRAILIRQHFRFARGRKWKILIILMYHYNMVPQYSNERCLEMFYFNCP